MYSTSTCTVHTVEAFAYQLIVNSSTNENYVQVNFLEESTGAADHTLYKRGHIQ